jgi:hypothetical protein
MCPPSAQKKTARPFTLLQLTVWAPPPPPSPTTRAAAVTYDDRDRSSRRASEGASVL